MSKSAPAPLVIPGMAKKGEAAPAVETLEPAPSSPPTPEPASPPVLPPSAKVRATIAVTVRLDEARYERLKSYGSKHRVTNQDILVAALDRFLSTS